MWFLRISIKTSWDFHRRELICLKLQRTSSGACLLLCSRCTESGDLEIYARTHAGRRQCLTVRGVVPTPSATCRVEGVRLGYLCGCGYGLRPAEAVEAAPSNNTNLSLLRSLIHGRSVFPTLHLRGTLFVYMSSASFNFTETGTAGFASLAFLATKSEPISHSLSRMY